MMLVLTFFVRLHFLLREISNNVLLLVLSTLISLHTCKSKALESRWVRVVLLHAKGDPLVRLEGSMPVAPTCSTVSETPKNIFETLVGTTIHNYTH